MHHVSQMAFSSFCVKMPQIPQIHRDHASPETKNVSKDSCDHYRDHLDLQLDPVPAQHYCLSREEGGLRKWRLQDDLLLCLA